MDVDGFYGLTDDTTDGVKYLACSLQLPLFEGLMKQLGTHVLQSREHIFAISLPVFIDKFFYSSPIPPSGFNRNLFFISVVIDECPSGQSI